MIFALSEITNVDLLPVTYYPSQVTHFTTRNQTISIFVEPGVIHLKSHAKPPKREVTHSSERSIYYIPGKEANSGLDKGRSKEGIVDEEGRKLKEIS